MKRKGFSLIELMMVIAIISLIAVIAIPAYNNYILKSKVSEGISLLKFISKQYEEEYNLTGSFYTGAQTILHFYTEGSVDQIQIAPIGTSSKAMRFLQDLGMTLDLFLQKFFLCLESMRKITLSRIIVGKAVILILLT